MAEDPKMTMASAYAESHPNAENMSWANIRSRASKLFDHPLVQARIKEIRDRTANRAGMTLDKHLTDLLILRNRAAQLGQMGAAITAEVARGKAAGLYIERAEVVHKVQELPSSVDDFV
jgi:phage terminase small subunit